MIIYINERKEIKDVNSTDMVGLTSIIIPEEDNPFKGWSTARIVCYKVMLDSKDNVIGFTPYIDSRIVEQLAHLDNDKQMQIDTATNDISDNRAGITETYEATDNNTSDISDLRAAVEEMYELMEV